MFQVNTSIPNLTLRPKALLRF